MLVGGQCWVVHRAGACVGLHSRLAGWPDLDSAAAGLTPGPMAPAPCSYPQYGKDFYYRAHPEDLKKFYAAVDRWGRAKMGQGMSY